MRFQLIVFIIVVALGVYAAPAATRTWTGAGSNNRFTTVENWEEGVAPTTGDDLIFPANSAQYSLFYDLFPDQILGSLSFEGGSYSMVGAGKSMGITINSGTQDLGTNMWTINGPVYVGDGASVSMIVFGRDSTVTVDGPGTSNMTVRGSFGGRLTKEGDGTATVRLDTGGINSLTVNGGRVIIPLSGTGTSGVFTVNNGYLQGNSLGVSDLKVTGSGSEFKGSAYTLNFEVSDGAVFSPTSCAGFVQVSASTPVLTGAMLNPSFSTCGGDPYNYLINNRTSSPITGAFVNYPEGATLMLGGRLFRVTYVGGDGNDMQVLAVPGVAFDFDGDGKANISAFRPSDGTWYIQNETGFTARQWGLPDDKIVPADYDGDGKTDVAVYRPSEGVWYIFQSSDLSVKVVRFGLVTDIAAPADYDGDGRADVAIFRPSDGYWWINRSVLGITGVPFGTDGDLPVPSDFDGDGKTDIAVFRPANGTWYVRGTSSGIFGTQWGQDGDKAVPADYDGDGKSDIAVFRPSEGIWYQFLSSTQSSTYVYWGNPSDSPVPADYDGDGRADIAIYRPTDGNWWIDSSSAGITVQQFGLPDDTPAASAYIR